MSAAVEVISHLFSTLWGPLTRQRDWRCFCFFNLNFSAIIWSKNTLKLLDELVGFPFPSSRELVRDSHWEIGARTCRVTRCRKYSSHEIFHRYLSICLSVNILWKKKNNEHSRNHKGPTHHTWGFLACCPLRVDKTAQCWIVMFTENIYIANSSKGSSHLCTFSHYHTVTLGTPLLQQFALFVEATLARRQVSRRPSSGQVAEMSCPKANRPKWKMSAC